MLRDRNTQPGASRIPLSGQLLRSKFYKVSRLQTFLLAFSKSFLLFEDLNDIWPKTQNKTKNKTKKERKERKKVGRCLKLKSGSVCMVGSDEGQALEGTV